MPIPVILADFWSDRVGDGGREGVLIVLLSFLVSFAFIRTSARLSRSPKAPWWPGSVVTGGVHLHHLVWGICLMLAGGTIGFAAAGTSPWFELAAVAFGIGAGFTFDEFALWIHLDDVYWSEEGRTSIDAVAVAASFMLFVLLGVSPLSFDDATPGAVAASIVGVLLLVLVCGTCFLKHRFWLGWLGIFVLPFALWGACRIGKPWSPYARRLYGERRPRKQEKAERRFPPDRRGARLGERLRDAVGGSSNEEIAERRAAATQARARVQAADDRERAQRARADPGAD